MMNNSGLKQRLKRRGYRVTKDVNGKRVPLTRNEMLSKLGNKNNGKSNNTLNREAHRVRKFIRVCKMILMNVNNARPVRNNTKKNKNNVKKNNVKKNNVKKNNVKNKPVRVPPPPPPPPPPRPPVVPVRAPRPPPPPPSVNPRQALMANLKANLRRRGLSN